MGQLSSRAKFAMAVGKNKRLTKDKRGSKKKIIDPFASKDWYDIKAPSIFQAPIVGKTIVSRTKGTKIASDGLKGRICEISLGDLNKNEDDAYRKMKLRVGCSGQPGSVQLLGHGLHHRQAPLAGAQVAVAHRGECRREDC